MAEVRIVVILGEVSGKVTGVGSRGDFGILENALLLDLGSSSLVENLIKNLFKTYAEYIFSIHV